MVIRRRDRGEGRDGESRGGNGGYDRPKSPRGGRDVNLIQRVVGAEVVTSLALVRNQDRKSAKLLDPLAFAVALFSNFKKCRER